MTRGKPPAGRAGGHDRVRRRRWREVAKAGRAQGTRGAAGHGGVTRVAAAPMMEGVEEIFYF
jgi:hypothetical protein